MSKKRNSRRQSLSQRVGLTPEKTIDALLELERLGVIEIKHNEDGTVFYPSKDTVCIKPTPKFYTLEGLVEPGEELPIPDHIRKKFGF